MVEQTELRAHVYHLDEVGGERGTWFWDFGFTTLVGNESYPTSRQNNLHSFSATVNGIDAETFEQLEPNKEIDVPVYEGDYRIYIETDSNVADSALSPTRDPYTIAENYDDGFLLKRKGTVNKTIHLENREFKQEDWIPVNTF